MKEIKNFSQPSDNNQDHFAAGTRDCLFPELILAKHKKRKFMFFEMALDALLKEFTVIVILLCPLLLSAQLAVTVSPPNVIAQKAMVQLKMKNNLAQAVKSARAVCFLLDDKGSMAGQSTKWVIGQNHASLVPKGETTFNFVITSPQPWTTTNLTAKVSFSLVVLEGDKLADVRRDVILQTAGN
jgi:competence protein ComGC